MKFHVSSWGKSSTLDFFLSPQPAMTKAVTSTHGSTKMYQVTCGCHVSRYAALSIEDQAAEALSRSYAKKPSTFRCLQRSCVDLTEAFLAMDNSAAMCKMCLNSGKHICWYFKCLYICISLHWLSWRYLHVNVQNQHLQLFLTFLLCFWHFWHLWQIYDFSNLSEIHQASNCWSRRSWSVAAAESWGARQFEDLPDPNNLKSLTLFTLSFLIHSDLFLFFFDLFRTCLILLICFDLLLPWPSLLKVAVRKPVCQYA